MKEIDFSWLIGTYTLNNKVVKMPFILLHNVHLNDNTQYKIK